jgi:hypothetical protein
MSKRSAGEPWQIGYRMKILLLAAFVLLFLAACWLVGTAMATSP